MSDTFFNTPGSVENFLHWSGGLEQGMRGQPPTADRPMSIEVTGVKETMAALNKYIKFVPDMVQNELAGWAEVILSESRKEVPWDTTHLLQTGTVEQDPDDSNALRIGYNAPYAARQHEDLTFHHPKPGRKAKYLEDPARRIIPRIAPSIVSRMNGYFSAGIPSMSAMSSSKRTSLGSLGGRFV